MTQTLQETLEYLYVPVWPDKVAEVLEQGLVNTDELGFMLVNRDTYAIGFINLTGGVRLNGVTDFEYEGKTIIAPAFDKFMTGIAVKIRVADLDETKLIISTEDYSSPIYPDDLQCFTYLGTIPPSAMLGHVEYKLNSPEIPMRP